MTTLNNSYQEILQFWFAKDTMPMWFSKDPDFDKNLKKNYLSIYTKASNQELHHWAEDPKSILALIIVLDQFPRSMFRDTPKAFASDDLSLSYAKIAIAKGYDKEIDINELAFLYMPFMHSEKLSDQDRSITLFSKPGLENNLEYAKQHRDIIARFGRYPHRNKILNRPTTEEEKKFLTEEHSGF